MATKSDDRTWCRSSANDDSKFATVTVFDGNADSHCGGVLGVAVEEVKARDRARDSAEEEGSVRSFMRVLRSGFRRGITRERILDVWKWKMKISTMSFWFHVNFCLGLLQFERIPLIWE